MTRHAVPQSHSAFGGGLSDTRIGALGGGDALHFDGLLSPQVAEDVRVTALLMDRAGELRPAGLGAAATRRTDLRGDEIAWLDPENLPPGLAPVVNLFEELMRALNLAAYLGARTLQCQIAVYHHGRGYARHLDASTPASSRRATAIFYANPWVLGDGGELEVWEDAGSGLLTPIAGRLVVFRSACTEHAVLPVVGAPRVAVSAFMHQ